MSGVPKLDALDHLVLTVRDVEATCAFYETVLGMTAIRFAVADGSTRRAMSFGRQKINLHQSGMEFDPKANRPTPGSADLCFLSAIPIEIWQEHLERLDIEVEEGPVVRTGATGSIRSLYLRDPDGNLIEVSNPIK